jgi:parallel beta-helix repeat protein
MNIRYLKKDLVLVMIFLFLGVGTVSGINIKIENSGVHVNFDGNTIYVDDDNINGLWDGTIDHPYQYIQDGVNASSNYDVVYVFSGLYLENVYIDKSITLTGENRETTIIDGNHSGNTICLRVSGGVTINGFTIQHSGDFYWVDAGINMYNINDNTIFNNIIKENINGIIINYCFNNRFYDNIIEENYNNGFFGNSQLYNSTVSDNIIRNNEKYGLYLYSSENNEIKNNIIENNSVMNILSAEGINNLITNNYVANSKYGIEVYMDWLTQIISNNITYNEYGLRIIDAQYTLIMKNNFIHNNVHAWFEAMFFWPPTAIIHWRMNYWSDSSRPMKIKGTTNIEIYNPWDSYHPFVIEIPRYQYDFFSAKTPYNIPEVN